LVTIVAVAPVEGWIKVKKWQACDRVKEAFA
jgi:hypothetical protein